MLPNPEVPYSDSRLEDLRNSNRRFSETWTPASTSSAYATHMRFYTSYLSERGLTDLAHHPEVLAGAMRSRVEEGKAESTVNGLASAVSAHFRFSSYAPTVSPVVADMRKRVKRATPSQKQTKAVDRSTCIRLLQHLDSKIESEIKEGQNRAALQFLRTRAIFTMLFITWARPASVVELQWSDVSPPTPLDFASFAESNTPSTIQIVFQGHPQDGTSGPKNNPGEAHTAFIAHNRSPELDLISCLHRYAAMDVLVREALGQLPRPKWVFYNITRDKFGQRLSPKTPGHSFKRCLRELGAEVDQSLTLYGLKSGGVTAARRAGLSPEVRKAHGGWSSDAHKVYDNYSEAERLHVSEIL